MKTICIDFDGVIHSYSSKWVSETHIPDPPVPGAFEFITECLDNKFAVVINSTRCKTLEGRDAIRRWLSDRGCRDCEFIALLDYKPPAILYIDDRGYCFDGNFPSMELIANFKPWNKA